MKKVIIVFLALFTFCKSFSQARITTTEYQKTPQPSIEVEMPFSEKTVTKAIDDKLQKLGYKGKESKGFMTYKGVKMAELGPDTYDLYFKTERKSRKEKDITVVTMLVSTGYDKFVSDGNSSVLGNAKNFLDSQFVMVEAFELEQQVTDQDNEVKKADKKMASLTEEAEELQKKKKKLEKDIEENLKAQENQKNEMGKQNQILNTLKGKRKQ